MSYAWPTTAANLERVRRMKEKYDPERVFG
jgi:hypothetical protein